MTAHLAPADLCDLIARLVREGYPDPIGVSFSANDVQVDPADVAAWQAVCVEAGEWSPVGGGDVYRACSLGFSVTAWREHDCAVAS
jgi:hypothetical protein